MIPHVLGQIIFKKLARPFYGEQMMLREQGSWILVLYHMQKLAQYGIMAQM